MLESVGRGHSNMSLMGAEAGVYSPENILEGEIWSIYGLNIFDIS